MLCRCLHDQDSHQHYRPGTDCGACGADLCPAFRPARERTVWSWLRGHLLGDLMAEIASVKSIALSTRILLQEHTMTADTTAPDPDQPDQATGT